MAQVAKSTQDFELFGGLNPGTVRVSTENSKDKVILARCAVFEPATADLGLKIERTATPWWPTAAPWAIPLICGTQLTYAWIVSEKFYRGVPRC